MHTHAHSTRSTAPATQDAPAGLLQLAGCKCMRSMSHYRHTQTETGTALLGWELLLNGVWRLLPRNFCHFLGSPPPPPWLARDDFPDGSTAAVLPVYLLVISAPLLKLLKLVSWEAATRDLFNFSQRAFRKKKKEREMAEKSIHYLASAINNCHHIAAWVYELWRSHYVQFPANHGAQLNLSHLFFVNPLFYFLSLSLSSSSSLISILQIGSILIQAYALLQQPAGWDNQVTL